MYFELGQEKISKFQSQVQVSITFKYKYNQSSSSIVSVDVLYHSTINSQVELNCT